MTKPFSLLSILLQLLLAAVSCAGSGSAKEEDWQADIDAYVDDPQATDMLELARLNLCLLETGQLVDKAFAYTQAGSQGLVPEWSQTPASGMALSDIYFAAGHVALAQRMAFEANVLDEADYEPRMLRRLVQTNLIYGAFPVAYKYLNILSADGSSKAFCEHYSKLKTEEDVASDPLLGPLKACVPPEDFICPVEDLGQDIKRIIRANPSYAKAVDFLGMLYLLDCDTEAFRGFVSEFYGTQALPSLHGAFAEAACILSEMYPGYWKKLGVSRGEYDRYRDFRTRLEAGLSLDKYKSSFWYYLMRVNAYEPKN